MARFASQIPSGQAVQQLEILVRTALFKPATAIVGFLLQQVADRIDDAYQPKAGEHFKGRQILQVQCLFGFFTIARKYYYHPLKGVGHFPAGRQPCRAHRGVVRVAPERHLQLERDSLMQPWSPNGVP